MIGAQICMVLLVCYVVYRITRLVTANRIFDKCCERVDIIRDSNKTESDHEERMKNLYRIDGILDALEDIVLKEMQ